LGSVFRFDVTLPLAAAAVLADATPAVTERTERSLRVLLAEDNPTNRVVALRLGLDRE